MITIKTPEEISIMAEGGRILAKTMKELGKNVKPGVATNKLDGLAEGLILKQGKCSFKGYHNFPTCLCVSINEEIVHAVPSERILKEGNVVSFDLGLEYKGFHTDMATTLPVGKISQEAKKLIEITKKALELGIKEVKPGNKVGDISKVVQKYVEGQGFNIVRELCGHGIGKNIHEGPEILNFISMPGVNKEVAEKTEYAGDGNIILKEGMVLCLEPMVTMGDWRIKKSDDGFGYKTKDGSLACHFEHTVVVAKGGCKVLTELK